MFFLPENVSFIINKLTAAGFEAYAVGGCVRDMLLGIEPKDWDITTSAEPYEVKALFRRTVDTGIKHGTVTVLVGDEAYETTTYRLDGKYEDSRHPSEITFTKCLSEDLLRRDFTINAMAYNETEGLVDLFGGQEDLEKKVIRCVGEPMERFGEDALRILRAYRFSARLGFSIDEKTREAAVALASTLSKISAERIREELSKLLLSPEAWRFTELQAAGITRVVLPELDVFFANKEAAERVLCGISRSLKLNDFSEHDGLAFGWGVIIAEAARELDESERKKFATELMRDLKFDNDSIRIAAGLAVNSQYRPEPSAECIRRTMNKMGALGYELWLAYLNEEHTAEGRPVSEEEYAEILKLTLGIKERGECISLKMLAVTGRDLLENGCPGGIALGECLDKLLDKVLAKPELNERETLLALAGEINSL